ncbi:MAG: hypothetical protein DWQ01_14025 [Planctomycetota bacterium]|nr:MAG: hypothetical protein DWQ01_14025 [Planctomycetota bacterium]
MKVISLLSVFALLSLASCQTGELQDTIKDQDEKLAVAHRERSRLIAERDRVQAENADLAERLQMENERNMEMRTRLDAMEAEKAASDAEVEALQATLAGTGVGVSRRGDVLVLDLPSAITFPSGKAELSAQGRESLQAVGDALAAGYADKTLWVEGHTDSDKITKSNWKSNLHLSVARATAVADYLVDELQVEAERVKLAGHGSTSPKVPNDTPENKASNRRVEILILD